MTSNSVARRYAQALFSLGKKTGIKALDGYASSLQDMQTALASSSELRQIFYAPVFTFAEKRKILISLAEKIKMNPIVLNFCLLLSEKNRMNYFDTIVDAYCALLDKEKGVLRGTLLTAISLGEKKQQTIVTNLEKKIGRTLKLDFGVMPEILGGVMLKVGDQVLDASIRAQLSILKERIKRGE